jgi:hypothetical protein
MNTFIGQRADGRLKNAIARAIYHASSKRTLDLPVITDQFVWPPTP